MQTLSAMLAITSLLMISYQDFAYRSVHWIYFPMLAIAGMLHSFNSVHSVERLLFFAACNIGFLILQFVLLKFYFFIRHKKLMPILDKHIGWGDILFLLAACFFFSPANFIAFYLYSLLLSLIVALVWTGFSRSISRSIPLAGLQSIFLLLSVGAGQLLRYSLLNDGWLVNKMFSS